MLVKHSVEGNVCRFGESMVAVLHGCSVALTICISRNTIESYGAWVHLYSQARYVLIETAIRFFTIMQKSSQAHWLIYAMLMQ